MKLSTGFFWIIRLLASVILLQTLFFKFNGAEESVYIFTIVGMEPWGRIGIGVLELVASILLLINRSAWMGALLAIGLMIGAIGMHLTVLGIEVKNDGGYLFILALLVLFLSAITLCHQRVKAIDNVQRLFNRN